MTISAQKLLIIPVFKNITNPNDTIRDLHKSQSYEKSTRFKLDSMKATLQKLMQLKTNLNFC